MQSNLDTLYPELDIEILGVNEYGFESGNGLIPGPTAGVSIPWIQDVDDNGDGNSDAWTDWQVTYRDVVILDEQNVPTAVYNLTTNGLNIPANYAELFQLFVNIALPPDANFDDDMDIDGIDFLTWQNGYGMTSGVSNQDGDADGNGNVTDADLSVWAQQFGQTEVTTDANFDDDTDIDGIDFLTWQNGYGMIGGATNHDGDADGNGVP